MGLQQIIAKTEEVGYEAAMLNVGGGRQVLAPSVRNSSRCIIDDMEMAEEIFNRIAFSIPKVFHDSELVRMNERLRFLRYDPGEYFRPHCE